MQPSLTIRGWPRRIQPADAFPHPFRRSYEQLGIPANEQPCLLYSPRLRFGFRESTAKLVVWSGQRLFCLDARRGGVVTTRLWLDQVHEVEWGEALLQAWIRLVAHGPVGLATVRVEVNAVGLELYKPILDTARSAAYVGARLSMGDEAAKLDPVLELDHRFGVLGRQALLTGVEVRRHWFQPRVTSRLLRAFDRTRIPALLLLVTQAELILIQEQAARGAGRYGCVWRCLPLQRIREVELLREPARGVLVLRVALPGDTEARVEVELAAESTLLAFLQETDPRWGRPVRELAQLAAPGAQEESRP